MEPTQLTLRTWTKILKGIVLALQQLLELLENRILPNDDEDVEPDKDLTRFTSITARRLVERAQIDFFQAELAKALHDAAADIQTADCPDARSAREQCRQAITNLLGPDAEKWRTFSDKIDLAMDFLAAKKRLDNLVAYQRAYHDIAEGIAEA